MKLKFLSIIIMCFFTVCAFSQSSLNDYKYIIVSKKYDFQKEENQYRLNSLASFLYKKQGFTTVFEGEQYPDDLASNICLGLNSDVEKGKGMFKTKLNIVLKNCKGEVVYTSEVGESREKEYDKAYIEALRGAFKSFETANYSYIPNEKNAVMALNKVETKSETSAEIQKLKEEIQFLKTEKEKVVEVVEVVEVAETKLQVEEIVEVPVKETEALEESVIEGVSNVLYAQEIENGFQLVDSSPKVVYRIIETGASNVFLVENKNAIIYKNGNSWFLESYSNSTLKQVTLNIKF